jgi:hypothetical protein
MTDARPANGSKAVKPRPPVPKIKSEEISEDHFRRVKDAHKELNDPAAKRGGLGGAPLFPGE